MKILHVTFSLDAGGIEYLIADIANQQVKSESVAVMVINNQVDISVVQRFHPSVEIIMMSRPPGSINPLHIIRVINSIRQFNPNIIHCHFESLIRFIHCTPGKKVLTVHGIHRQYDKNLSKYDLVCGISQGVCSDLSRRGLISKPVLVYNGVDHSIIQMKSEYNNAPLRVVCIGRLKHQTKGQDVLIRAMHEIVYTHGIHDVNVDFIGDGPSLNYLLDLVHQVGVERYCKFLGAKPRAWVFQCLRDYDLLVQPSRREAFGLSIAEAMMAKVPVLVSNIPGASEVIDCGTYGYAFTSADPINCAHVIIGIMSASSNSKIKTMVEAAYQHAIKNFSIATISNQYIDQYRLLLKNIGE